MTHQPCPVCGDPIELDIVWRADGDGDGPWACSWVYPDLGTEARCPTCGTEIDADTLDQWLDEITLVGPPDLDY